LKNFIEENSFTTEKVFNDGKTGLFWEKNPSRAMLSKIEKTAPGFKAAKD
jgi:hypothetical protein